MNKKLSIGSVIIWLGSVLPLLLPLLLWLLSKQDPQKKVNIISKYGKIVFDLLVKNGFNSIDASFIMSQAAHETGNFTSNIFKSNNNLFGMKYVSTRFAEGEKNGYAYYKDLEQSVLDYKRLFLLRGWGNFLSIDNFVSALKRGNYFEDTKSNYQAGVQYFYDLYFTRLA
jgi:hypothetical protein